MDTITNAGVLGATDAKQLVVGNCTIECLCRSLYRDRLIKKFCSDTPNKLVQYLLAASGYSSNCFAYNT